MFFKNLIPALVKLMISVKDDMSKKVKKRVRCNECAYSLCQTHSFQEEGPKDHSRKNDTDDASSSRMYVFPMPNSHSCPRPKSEKSEKGNKKSKKSSKSDIAPLGPQSGTKQSIWRGYPTGRERGDVGLESKTDPKRRFRSSKIDEKPCRILRILLFSSSGFSDRLWQNDRFCCMICTSF